MAMGSASELENHLQLARDLKFLNETDFQQLNTSTTEVKRMLASLLRTIKTKG